MLGEVRYSEDLIDEICEKVACGSNLTQIEKLPRMPSRMSFYRWMNKEEYVRQKYEAALVSRLETRYDTLLELVEKTPDNFMAIKKMEAVIKMELWFMEKINPRKYGQRTVIAGDKDNPIHLGLAQSLEAKIAEAKTKSRPIIDHKPRGNDLAVMDVESEETV